MKTCPSLLITEASTETLLAWGASRQAEWGAGYKA